MKKYILKYNKTKKLFNFNYQNYAYLWESIETLNNIRACNKYGTLYNRQEMTIAIERRINI